MYTQCPDCETIFQVTADQLTVANGDVRCGTLPGHVQRAFFTYR